MTSEIGTNGKAARGDDARATAYVLDELTTEERERFERELATDAELADEVRALDALSATLRDALRQPNPGLDFERRAEILRSAPPRQAPSPWRATVRVAVRMAASVGLIFVVGVTAYVSVRTIERERGLSGHGYIGPGAGASADPVFIQELRGLFSSDRAPASPAVPAAEELGYSGGSDTALTSAEMQQLEALGYSGGTSIGVGSGGHYGAGTPSAFASRRSGPGLRDLLQGELPGTEAYDAIAESGFLDPRRQPLSTFSIDVDTASYANVRRFLNERALPPADAVRIEELVNYFRYDYPEPQGATPFSVVVDSASAPWASEHRLVRIGLRGRAPESAKPSVKNLVFLVDVSGSMDEPAKLPLVQRSLRLLVDQLAPDDRVAIVVYAGSSGLVLPPTSVDARTRIQDAIENLKAGGSTNGGEGIQLAYKTARQRFAEGGVNRVILATDGDFNVGITDRAALLSLIEQEAKSGVFLSVLGFGTGNLKDATMEQLADHGNGNYAYVDSLAEARKVLVRELGATLVTIAKDVKIQVEFNPAKVSAYRLIGYENRALAARDFNDDQKDAGEIGAGHTVTALYEIVPAGVELERVDALRYQDPAPREAADSASGELLTVKLRYKQPSADTSELLTVPFTDEGRAFEQSAPDLRFAAAVAAFGMCLRDSQQRGSATLRDVYRWAEPALGKDVDGDRREFLKLVDLAAGLSGR